MDNLMTVAQGGISTLPVNIVGSNKFGRYPKINDSETTNMIISEDWLVPFAGYEKVISTFPDDLPGRGIFASRRYNHIIRVVRDIVYVIDTNLAVTTIGTLNTNSGDVFIAEIAGVGTTGPTQIGICDKRDIWIYDWTAHTFTLAVLDFQPNYLSSHGATFLAGVTNEPLWRFSTVGDGTSWPVANTGALQSKPDNVEAIFPFPSKENVLIVMGSTVAEIWTNTGATLFPYQRSSYTNFDYGCINSSTIAFSDRFVVWLGANEKSGIALLVSDGTNVNQISTDGINFVMANLTNPSNVNAFLFKQDGHLLYQFTFPDDNISYVYDFNTKAFFSVTDEDVNYHIAKSMVFFNKLYYFDSLKDGQLYESNSAFNELDGTYMPKFRKTKNIQTPTGDPFIAQNLSFVVETGVSNSNIFSQHPYDAESYLTAMDTLQIENLTVGNVTNIDAGTSGFTVATIQVGTAKLPEISSVVTVAASVLSGGEYFAFTNGLSVTYNVWYTVADVGTAPGGNDIKVELVGDENASQVAQQTIDRINELIRRGPPRIDLSLSRDGGVSYGNKVGLELPEIGKRQRKVDFWNMGRCNQLTFQLQFWGATRAVSSGGVLRYST